jgi:hypothetical protein
VTRPTKLLTQNSELRKAGVYNWTLPAWVVHLPNGERFNTCPNAGVCARVCYARFGTYRFSNVRQKHMANLLYVLEDSIAWEAQMNAELRSRKFRASGKPHELDHDPRDFWLANWIKRGGKAVRIHDAGDFFCDDYLCAWIRIAQRNPDILFYAYTKEVERFKRHIVFPINFRFVYSFGGLQDSLIDVNTDRHADVFPSRKALGDAGYYDQEDNDLLAISAPTNKIGIVANNIPTANKRFDGRSMSKMVRVRRDDETPSE